MFGNWWLIVKALRMELFPILAWYTTIWGLCCYILYFIRSHINGIPVVNHLFIYSFIVNFTMFVLRSGSWWRQVTTPHQQNKCETAGVIRGCKYFFTVLHVLYLFVHSQYERVFLIVSTPHTTHTLIHINISAAAACRRQRLNPNKNRNKRLCEIWRSDWIIHPPYSTSWLKLICPLTALLLAERRRLLEDACGGKWFPKVERRLAPKRID